MNQVLPPQGIIVDIRAQMHQLISVSDTIRADPRCWTAPCRPPPVTAHPLSRWWTAGGAMAVPHRPPFSGTVRPHALRWRCVVPLWSSSSRWLGRVEKPGCLSHTTPSWPLHTPSSSGSWMHCNLHRTVLSSRRPVWEPSFSPCGPLAGWCCGPGSWALWILW